MTGRTWRGVEGRYLSICTPLPKHITQPEALRAQSSTGCWVTNIRADESEWQHLLFGFDRVRRRWDKTLSLVICELASCCSDSVAIESVNSVEIVQPCDPEKSWRLWFFSKEVVIKRTFQLRLIPQTEAVLSGLRIRMEGQEYSA